MSPVPVMWSAWQWVLRPYNSLSSSSLIRARSLSTCTTSQSDLPLSRVEVVHITCSNTGSIKIASRDTSSARRYVYVDDSPSNNCRNNSVFVPALPRHVRVKSKDYYSANLQLGARPEDDSTLLIFAA
jgi:hypothetical protein